MHCPQSSFLFDLDGTLVDSVYQHVLAWHEALDRRDRSLDMARPPQGRDERRPFHKYALRETQKGDSPEWVERLLNLHAAAYKRRSLDVQPLSGAPELFTFLADAQIPWAIASGRMDTARPVLEQLEIDFDRVVIVTRDQVRFAKPDPFSDRCGTAGSWD